jgi:hypothetical protein
VKPGLRAPLLSFVSGCTCCLGLGASAQVLRQQGEGHLASSWTRMQELLSFPLLNQRVCIRMGVSQGGCAVSFGGILSVAGMGQVW